MTTKKKTTNNLTKKVKSSKQSSKQLEIYCKQHANTFNSFEKNMKKVNVNLPQYDKNLKNKLTNLFKTPLDLVKLLLKMIIIHI